MKWWKALPAKVLSSAPAGVLPDLTDHYIRVSVGEDWENELFVQEINTL